MGFQGVPAVLPILTDIALHPCSDSSSGLCFSSVHEESKPWLSNISMKGIKEKNRAVEECTQAPG